MEVNGVHSTVCLPIIFRISCFVFNSRKKFTGLEQLEGESFLGERSTMNRTAVVESFYVKQTPGPVSCSEQLRVQTVSSNYLTLQGLCQRSGLKTLKQRLPEHANCQVWCCFKAV